MNKGSGIRIVVRAERVVPSFCYTLLTCATLAFPKDSATMCLLTDASHVGWSLIVTQVANWDKDRPVQEQSHELLVCLSGTFTGSRKN